MPSIATATMSEAELLDSVIELAHPFGWRAAHFRPAMTKHGWRTPVSADGKGFPDLVLVRERVLFVELKSARGRLIGDQLDWAAAWSTEPLKSTAGARRTGRTAKSSPSFGAGRLLIKSRSTQTTWGLVPFWAKDPSVGSRAFNARAETVSTKPMFRRAFEKRRILIPADAFYEWTKTGGPKVPNAFRRTDGDPIVFAGLCEYWKAPDDQWLASATIITTSDNPDMHEIHNRMPVILEKNTWDEWVNPGTEDLHELQELLKLAKKGTLEHYPVSKEVGKVTNNGEYLVELNSE